MSEELPVCSFETELDGGMKEKRREEWGGGGGGR